MAFHTHTLPNGLTLIGETIPTALSASFGFYVRTGSRDEIGAENGVSHFLEHMMFKGTARRTALEVNLDFDRIGADYNASTSEETTCYFATVLPEYLPTAIDILADIMRPSLREQDFDTEKQVILEEIKMYEDSPASMVWDRAKTHYFGDHPLGQSILGPSAGIAALSRGQMQDYFSRRYAPNNVVAVVCGAVDWDAVVACVEKQCGHWSGPTAARSDVRDHRPTPGVHLIPHAAATQENVLMLSRGAAAESPLRYAGALLATAVGDDSGSRIYWELVDPGLVENAGCMVDRAEGTGLFVATLTGDPEATGKNLKHLQRIFDEVQRDGITEDELTQAKNKVMSRIVRANERPKGRLHSLAGAWLYNREQGQADTEIARFDAVTTTDIRSYLDEYPIDKLTITAYGPLTTLVIDTLP